MSQQLNHQRQRHRLEWLVKFIKRLSYWFSCCRLSSCTEWVRCVETSNSVECRLLRFCSSTKECKCENECMNKSWVIVVNLYTDFLSSTLLLSHHHHTTPLFSMSTYYLLNSAFFGKTTNKEEAHMVWAMRHAPTLLSQVFSCSRRYKSSSSLHFRSGYLMVRKFKLIQSCFHAFTLGVNLIQSKI